MSPGKAAAMAGHAFVNAALIANSKNPTLISKYQGSEFIGTKVCLKAKNLRQILWAYEHAQALAIPCSLIEDSGHIHPPDFTGEPIIVGLGLGPTSKLQAGKITNKFGVLK